MHFTGRMRLAGEQGYDRIGHAQRSQGFQDLTAAQVMDFAHCIPPRVIYMSGPGGLIFLHLGSMLLLFSIQSPEVLPSYD
jgi:hypothetical protein